jgi:hypothetical protein
LARSKYAKNKPGKPVYPPGAIIEDLPFNRHRIEVVNDDTVMPSCTAAKKR